MRRLTAGDGFVPPVLHLPRSAAGWLWQTGWEPAESHSPADPAATGWIQSAAGPVEVKAQHISNQPHRFTSLTWSMTTKRTIGFNSTVIIRPLGYGCWHLCHVIVAHLRDSVLMVSCTVQNKTVKECTTARFCLLFQYCSTMYALPYRQKHSHKPVLDVFTTLLSPFCEEVRV